MHIIYWYIIYILFDFSSRFVAIQLKSKLLYLMSMMHFQCALNSMVCAHVFHIDRKSHQMHKDRIKEKFLCKNC
jgi:hypothetical protein